MKFGFVTCVQLGMSCVEKIYEIGGSLDLIITLNDNKAIKKSGRVYIDEFTNKHRIDLVKINHINDDEAIHAIADHEIDWLFIIGWSQIAGRRVLDTPKKGVIGMHPTLLPMGRGRASIPWAIIKGLDETGVSMFKLDDGVDTGKLLRQQVISIEPRETATSLYEKVNLAHAELIESVWYDLINDTIILTEQNEDEATYWPGRKPEDGEIHESMSVTEVDRLVRATTKPYPGAFFIRNRKKIVIWEGTTRKDFSSEDDLAIQLRDGTYWVSVFDINETG